MQICFSPIRSDQALRLVRAGDRLTINEVAYDFSGIPDGGTLPREAVDCDWLVSDVTRMGGVLYLTLLLPHGAQAPAARLFPVPITAPDGVVALPPETGGTA